MSAPAIDTAPPGDIPADAAPIVLPVMVIEGLETSDRRYIEPGTIEVRDLPIPLFAATRSTHGDTGDAATWHVGAITSAERIPGPEAQLYGDETLPEGTFVWVGRGWMYKDVPAAPAKSAYQLVYDRALRGNSVDMTEVVAEFQGPNGELADQSDYSRISMQRGVIAATTLVGIPAFAGAYITLDGETLTPDDGQDAMVAAGVRAPGWLSSELGDLCHTCQVDDMFSVDGLHEFVSAAKRKASAEAGHAMPGGRYPIDTEADLDKAIKAVGRAGGPSGTEEDRDAVRRHIIKQAKRLKLTDKIPDSWNSDGTLKTAGKQAATGDRAWFDFEDDGVFDPGEPPAVQDYSTSGMVALVPANPQMLVAPGGDPASELHLTLAYLGDQIDTWDADMIAAVHRVARRLTDFEAAAQEEAERMRAAGQDPDEAGGVTSMSKSAAQKGPLDAGIFSWAVFNPNGDDGHQPATVYLLDGTGDRIDIDWLRNDVVSQVRNAIGDVTFPDQHEPYVPHVTAGYGLDPSQLTYTGPVTFDRLRVAIGDDVTDYPLGGGSTVLVASAADLPPAEWFADPGLTEPTPITIDDDGRIVGHLAAWNTCHTGIVDRCRTAPRSAANYAYFRVHPCRARTADGEVVTVPVGYGSVSKALGVGGHAPARGGMSLAEVAAHYDNTCTAAMELAAGEDEHGIWVAGRLMPGLDADTEYKARGAALSGDWRRIRGSMELLAALAVNAPGYPVPFKALVASGEPQVILAAGSLQQSPQMQQDRADAALARVCAEVQSVFAIELDQIVPSLGDIQDDHIANLVLALDGDHPWFNAQLTEYGDGDTLTAAGKKKLHLPPFIKRISKHLRAKGMTESHAIASAVNAAKKMCATGDLNFPGHQDVNPGSRAEACAAVAQWKKDRPGAV